MRKGLTAGLLVLACFGASVTVSAAQQINRGSSDTYKWETEDHGCVEIYKVLGTSTPATVVVHVKDRSNSQVRGGNDGIRLKNCAAHHDHHHNGNSCVHVDRNETVQCKVWPGHPLIAEPAGECQERGTVEVIKI